MVMSWETLLTDERLIKGKTTVEAGRSPFQIDIDRISFSSPFRRLANKTQVHPLADDDHTHNRLTHSIEVSLVGRSLGTVIGEKILEKHPELDLSRDEIGYIIQAACLAHDIGNPPYGHAGESAIGEWFAKYFTANPDIAQQLTDAQKTDLTLFEGNAQGFRILTHLEMYKTGGGMRLTNAVLATFSKYTCASHIKKEEAAGYIGAKKFGFNQAELPFFTEVAEKTGLPRIKEGMDAWKRHPFAYLVEAADDICYRIIDLEDGFQLGDLEFEEVKEILYPIAANNPYFKLNEDQTHLEQVGHMRAMAIGECTKEIPQVFMKFEDDLLAGTFEGDLIGNSIFANAFEAAGQLCKEKLFKTESKATRELGGYAVIESLLNKAVPAAIAVAHGDKISHYNQQVCTLIASNFIERNKDASLYEILLQVTDFISGMTDRYAFSLHKKLSGTDI
ncbi:deoxyguanosinetriphosphate triphosphohydrolase [Curvivirga aplysinae]|uniref:deoxyguanosinetriphosphate triphosphohydrolase n=1 Tax=Curvivirga aplysinae TaxID=2529852 RepID=UPI0012BC07C0|nr:deoxyguanosinetriphosphate triphosphohydrolase [Curvivirga aplysinae]MTI11420.1 deoxyguanosinetriphosphate triphosphohydrolase [Curvivirga aplysinae]